MVSVHGDFNWWPTTFLNFLSNLNIDIASQASYFMGLFILELNFLIFIITCIFNAANIWLSSEIPNEKINALNLTPISNLVDVDVYLNFFRDLIPPIVNVDFSIPVAITAISIPYLILKFWTDQIYKTARDKNEAV